MEAALNTPISQTPTSQAKGRKISVPPPVGGWNTRDDPVQMGLTDATSLVNFWPERNQVGVRRGFVSHATGVGSGNVDTVAEFFDGSTRKIIAASSTNLYDATTAGAASSLGSGFTEGRWQTAMMNGVMGLVNGADAPQTYDGTTLGAMTLTGSGFTADEFIGIHIFKSRSYFWKADSPSFWYSAVNSLGGTVTEFALGEVANEGGYLVAMSSWSVDGGAGPDDYAVFLMSSGEVLVYQGSDPGTSADWALVGSYKIPPPLDIRGVQKVGGQVAVLTESDIVMLPEAFDKPTPPQTKLRGAMELAGATYRANTGWQLIFYPRRSMLFANVPLTASSFEQYCLNTETAAGARFVDMDARSWGISNEDLYFGGTGGVVYQADIGTDDNGSRIDADAKQAWNDLGNANIKQVSMMRPVFSGSSSFNAGSGVGFNFTHVNPTREVTSGGGGTPWGSPWGSPWGASQTIRDDWKLAAGSGQNISIEVSIGVSDERPVWYRTDLVLSQGMSI